MLNRKNPFTLNDIINEFDRSESGIRNIIRSLIYENKLLKQTPNITSYYINREFLNESEVAKINATSCKYINNEIVESICKIYCKFVHICPTYEKEFDLE